MGRSILAGFLRGLSFAILTSIREMNAPEFNLANLLVFVVVVVVVVEI